MLPPEVTQARFHWLVTRQRDRTLYTILIGVVFVATAYAVNWYTLYQTEIAIRGELMNLETRTSTPKEEVGAANRFIRALASRLINADSWVEEGTQILSRVPSGVVINHLQSVSAIVERQPANAVVIEGTATNRESLAKFEENLRAFTWVDHLEAPLRNFSGNNSLFSFLFITFRTE